MSVVSSVSIPNQSLHNVFVYGSLLADDVVHVLLRRVPPCAPATLPDHHRFSVKGRVYPAILPVEDKKVTGRMHRSKALFRVGSKSDLARIKYVLTDCKVLQGISDLELFILDEFEDVEYERSDVDVYLKDNSEKLQAHTYIWSNKSDPNLYGDWDFEEWKRTYMNDFIKMTEQFIKELDLPESKRRIQTYESVFKQDNDKPPEP